MGARRYIPYSKSRSPTSCSLFRSRPAFFILDLFVRGQFLEAQKPKIYLSTYFRLFFDMVLLGYGQQTSNRNSRLHREFPNKKTLFTIPGRNRPAFWAFHTINHPLPPNKASRGRAADPGEAQTPFFKSNGWPPPRTSQSSVASF